MVMEGVRGSGIEGDIAIDDLTIEEGECKDPPPNSESADSITVSCGTRTIQTDPDLQSSLSVCFPHRSEVARPALIATYMAAVQYSGSDWLAEVTPSSSVRDAVTFDSTAPPPSHPPPSPSYQRYGHNYFLPRWLTQKVKRSPEDLKEQFTILG